MDSKIVGGKVVTASETFRADVGIKNGRIVQLASRIKDKARQTIEAKGCYILPGAIDVHTHLDMPFGGSMTADDFFTGTRAAAFGGTTCLIDFAIQGKGQSLSEALEAWHAKADGKACFDYGFHLAVTDAREEVIDELDQVVKHGVTSFKVFLAYKGSLMIDDGAFFKILRRAKEVGALTMLHAENGEIIDVLVNEALAAGNTEPIYHALTRPEEVESEATARAISLAEMAGAPLYVVHLSCALALEQVKAAREGGLPIMAETCPQYLLLDIKRYLEPDFEGAKYVMSPPLRDRYNWPYLWRGLADGDLQVVSTDHAPFNFKGQKEMGRDNFAAIPNGAPGIENRVALIFNEGVRKNRISLNKMVDLLSTTPAKIFGLAPRKGSVAIGADADLVVFDPRAEMMITAETNHHNMDYTPYEGFKGKGRVVHVLCNGELIVDGDEFLGQAGQGRFIKRNKFSYVA